MFSTRTGISTLFLRRQVHSNAEILNNCKEIRNRNPRNLERLRIARKPEGYFLDKPGRAYWHKLAIKTSSRYVTAVIEHFKNGTVISASSQEWGLKTQLYRGNDVSAYRNVGRVLAQRCLESGICEVYWQNSKSEGDRVKSLIKEVQEGGVSLREPQRYKHPNPWDRYRPEKTWETFE